MRQPRYHATPPEAITETLRETVFVGKHTFRIDRPADSDKLLDHPWVRSAYAADEYVPYWAQLWPAARMLAKVVVREKWETHPRPLRVLEVGCGLGLAGIACLARGLAVTFSDVDETALTFAAANATAVSSTSEKVTRSPRARHAMPASPSPQPTSSTETGCGWASHFSRSTTFASIRADGQSCAQYGTYSSAA